MKENRGGFLDRIDVDLLVSSMKGVTIMKSIQEENMEYDKFVISFAQKFQEMQRDYNNLSAETNASADIFVPKQKPSQKDCSLIKST